MLASLDFMGLTSGVAGLDVSSGSLLSNYDGDVTITGTVTLAGISTITFVSSKLIFYNLFIIF